MTDKQNSWEITSTTFNPPVLTNQMFSLLVLVNTLSAEDLAAYSDYLQEKSEITDSIVRNSLQKPDIPPAEYRKVWFNKDHYAIDKWMIIWDAVDECTIVDLRMLHLESGEVSIYNAKYTEKQWLQKLESLGYSLLDV